MAVQRTLEAPADVGRGLGPRAAPCPPDFRGCGVIAAGAAFAFREARMARDPRGDSNGIGTNDTRDVLAFINAWAAGC